MADIEQMPEPISGQTTIYDELGVSEPGYYVYDRSAKGIHVDYLLAKLADNGSEFGLRLAIAMVEEYERRHKADEVITQTRMPFLYDVREAIHTRRF